MKFSPVRFGFLSLVHSDGIVLSGQQTHHYIKSYCIIHLTALTVKQFSDRNNLKKWAELCYGVSKLEIIIPIIMTNDGMY